MTRRITAIGMFLCFVCAPARAQEGFTFEMMEPEVENAGEARFADARRLLSDERFSEAIFAYDGIIDDAGMEKYHAAAQYDAAKALYRMGLLHAALTRFEDIVKTGAGHPHAAPAREWLFYIARRMKDQRRVVSLIAEQMKSEDMPSEYASELNYQLARHFFLLALEEEANSEEVPEFEKIEQPAPPVEEAPEESDPDLRLEFELDELESVEEEKSGPGETPAGENNDFDFDFDDLGGGDDDGFSFEFGDVAQKKSKRKKRSTKKQPSKKSSAVKKRKTSEEAASKSSSGRAGSDSMLRAQAYIERVDPAFALYAKAQYLKGLIHFALDDFEQAVDAFQSVVRITNPKGGTVNNLKLREMAFFSLARIHYQFEQFRYAIFYYERVSRDSEAWLDALFESSWAHFRLGEHEKALGNLITIQSPFFQDGYYPESHILKAITYYENCRYPEAQSFLDEYQGQYGGIMEELSTLIAANDTPEQVWERVQEIEKRIDSNRTQRSGAILSRILSLILQDKRLAVYRNAIQEVDDETSALQQMDAPFGGSAPHDKLVEKLGERRGELARAAGTLLANRLKQELAMLRDLGAKLVRIRFEVTKQEKEALAASLRGEDLTVPLSDYRFTAATDDERVYWPFEGEYWRDELGTYEYTLTKGCRPASMDDG